MQPEERETIIRFDDSSDTATLYTCNQSWMTKMDKLVAKSQYISCTKEDKWSKTYSFPKKYVKVHLPQEISVEEREKRALRARERMAVLNAKRKEQKNGTDE